MLISSLLRRFQDESKLKLTRLGMKAPSKEYDENGMGWNAKHTGATEAVFTMLGNSIGAVCVPMSVRDAVRMMSSEKVLAKSMVPSWPHFEKKSCRKRTLSSAGSTRR